MVRQLRMLGFPLLLLMLSLVASCSSHTSGSSASSATVAPTDAATQEATTTAPSVQPLVATDDFGYRWSIIATAHAQSDVQQSPPGKMQVFIPVTITNLQNDRPANLGYWMPGNGNSVPAEVLVTMPQSSYNIAFPNDGGCTRKAQGLCLLQATVVPANGQPPAELAAGASMAFDAVTAGQPLQDSTPLQSIGVAFYATQGGMTDVGPLQQVPIGGN